MKTVRIYYAGIPSKNKNLEKELVLRNFHLGVSNNQSVEVKTMDWQLSDLAVIQGWVHENSDGAAHLKFRREIINKQKLNNKSVLAIDSNLFLYRDPENSKQYLRFSLNDIFPTTGNYFTDQVDSLRWQQIKTDIGFDLQPWRTKGSNILICLQRNGGWSMKNVNVVDWCNHTISQLRKYTDRPIVVRAHPGDRRASEYIKHVNKGVKISKNPNLLEDLTKTWATITYNSSPGVASAIEGVPVFVTDPNPRISQAYDVANTDLSKIESPQTFERQQWIEKLSMSHFNFNDLRTGVAWNIIKEYL